MTLHKDPSAGGHRAPYFLLTAEVILAPNGKGYQAHIKGTASTPNGINESVSLEMTGPLTSKGTWVTDHPWGWLGFQPIDLRSCPYPPVWGWHECPEKMKIPQYLFDATSIWMLPTQERLDSCKVSGKVG